MSSISTRTASPSRRLTELTRTRSATTNTAPRSTPITGLLPHRDLDGERLLWGSEAGIVIHERLAAVTANARSARLSHAYHLSKLRIAMRCLQRLAAGSDADVPF